MFEVKKSLLKCVMCQDYTVYQPFFFLINLILPLT